MPLVLDKMLERWNTNDINFISLSFSTLLVIVTLHYFQIFWQFFYPRQFQGNTYSLDMRASMTYCKVGNLHGFKISQTSSRIRHKSLADTNETFI